jgi:hypothetical protein
MKKVGLVIIGVGLAILAFGAISYFQKSQRLISPVPEGEGVKVIYITPGSSR